MLEKKIKIPSENTLGIDLYAVKIDKYSKPFKFPKGKEYPIIMKIDKTSTAYKHGLRPGHILISLNGNSLYRKDIATVQCDFYFEKRNEPLLEIVYK